VGRDFGFWIADFGLKARVMDLSSNPKSKIRNRKEVLAIALNGGFALGRIYFL
jgi:hypothetical protein